MTRVKKRPAQEEIRVEYVPLIEVQRWPRNPRKHDEKSLDASIERFGFCDPLTVDGRTGKLVEGHGRVEALARRRSAGKEPPERVRVDESGEWLVPVVRGVSFRSDREAEAYLVAHNRIAETGGWDDAALLEVLADAQADVTGLGWDADDVSEMLEGGRRVFESTRVAIADLRQHPRNYKQHPDDEIAHIQESIRLHGFYKNVVVARDLTILAGHGVVEAARRMGRKKVPVIRLDVDPLEPRALKVLTSDNEIAHLAETDDRALSELLKSILDSDGLAGTGFDEHQLSAMVMVTRPRSEIQDHDAAAHWVGLPTHEREESMPPRVIVTCDSIEAVDAVMALLGVKPMKRMGVTSRTWSVRYPPRDRDDNVSVRFDDQDS